MSIALEPEVVPAFSPTEPPPDCPDRKLVQLSVEQYHRMIEAGVFNDSPRLELVEGYLLAMSPIGPPHSSSVSKTHFLLQQKAPANWVVRMQQPLTLTRSELEPDVTVVLGTFEDYETRHPRPADTGLVVEVSDSTLASDRGLKAALYAAGGVIEYWIVNLVDRQVEVHKRPAPGSMPNRGVYLSIEAFQENDLVPFELEGRRIAEFQVSTFLPTRLR